MLSCGLLFARLALLGLIGATLTAWLPGTPLAAAFAGEPVPPRVALGLPLLATDNPTIDRAYRIALGDLTGNIRLHQSGLLTRPAPVVLAGLDYGTPWTRDASINSSNAVSLLAPDVARNTLRAVLEEDSGGVRIGGQYWDAIVWAIGAWDHYLCTGDRVFLKQALAATTNTLAQRERTEWDARTGLFRGPGWSDGVAGYPARYTNPNGSSAILDWPTQHSDKKVAPGVGIPIEALSTNCLYYRAYVVAGKMARELGRSPDPTWAAKATALQRAINRQLWDPETGLYRYFIDPWKGCDYQEGLGHAYAILFAVADPRQVRSIFQHLHVAPAGLPCQWPSFPRYAAKDGQAFARHSGTVWPQIQAFWAEAAARHGRSDLLGHELYQLARHAVRDSQFTEIYHPLTGEIYGGMQEAGQRGIIQWRATSRQTWAATALLRMVFRGLAGMRFERDRLAFQPCIPKGIARLRLEHIPYRSMTIDLLVHGAGNSITQCRIDGQAADRPSVAATAAGHRHIEIWVKSR